MERKAKINDHIRRGGRSRDGTRPDQKGSPETTAATVPPLPSSAESQVGRTCAAAPRNLAAAAGGPGGPVLLVL